MGCVQSTGIDDEAKARNDEIESQLKRDRMMAKNEIKMLLLGAGESGKSTVLKQMKLIHHGGYNESERESYREIIYSNTIQSMRAILEAMPQLDLALSPQNDARRATILALPPQIEADVLPGDVADAIQSLAGCPIQNLANARPAFLPAKSHRSSIRPVARTSDIDYDKIPSPRPNTSSQKRARNGVPGPSSIDTLSTVLKSHRPISNPTTHFSPISGSAFFTYLYISLTSFFFCCHQIMKFIFYC